MQVFGVAGTSVVACVWFIIVTSMSHEHWMSPLLVALTPIVFSVSSIPTVKTPSCDNDVPAEEQPPYISHVTESSKSPYPVTVAVNCL